MIFTSEIHSTKESSEEMDKLHAQIGQFTIEHDLGQNARSLNRVHRKSSLAKPTLLPIRGD